ncbi:hypothetical protein PENSTE_c046G08691 [Penicillium steckii]|uniref:NAD(P)-binding domain-containing protein n=1 Tax=Penicillium steckii TaxID=303698 RepID=A0A1V6SJK0_9EURO|nr:hypothetical protein PENSTE_c046G08691 [Penicillium steckii]
MTILVLGGRGKTAGHLSELLNNANIPFLLGTSSTSHKSPYTLTHFDWLDETTYENPFLQASSASLKAISAVYLVAPPVDDMAPPMIKFIDLCRSKGVKRFILLSASNINKGDHSMGQAHAHLDSCQDIEYVSLRPTWFMENLVGDPYLDWIKTEGKIYTATQNGKVPFISAFDIAQVAFCLLKEWKAPKKEYFVLGPELISYDEVADILTEVLGRKISHVSMSEAEYTKFLTDSAGLPHYYAATLASMEAEVAVGGEEKNSDDVKEVTGVSPLAFRDFAAREKGRWL